MKLMDTDQAEGLRKLLARTSSKVITVVGARSGIGSTSIVINLASAFAREGKDVLILDEHLSASNVANSLALKPRYDLFNVIKGDKILHEVILRGSKGTKILPIARAMHSIPLLRENERERLLEQLTNAATGADVVLVDAAAREENSFSASLSGVEPMLMILNGTAKGITESYALLKKIVLNNGRQSFNIVVNKMNNAHNAKAIYDNFAQVAWQNLQVRMEYLGYIPVDEKLTRSTQLCGSVLEAFPGAQSATALGEIAQSLMNSKKVEDEEEGSLTRVMQRLIRHARPIHNVISAI